MNPTDINDLTAVKTLLDQLRASRAWQDTLSSSSSSERPVANELSPSTLEDAHGESTTLSSDTIPSTSVASLLSQLRTSEWTSTATNTPPVSNTRTAHQLSRPIPRPSHDLSQPEPPRPDAETSSTCAQDVQDIRFISFQQALPHLTQLASDPALLTAISRLRQEQNDLEQQLWEERQTIHKKHEEKVKVARTKATLIGAGLSKHEADMINDAYRRDLQRFDKERVLLAWNGLIQKQQAALETLGVPTMFATTSQADCEVSMRCLTGVTTCILFCRNRSSNGLYRFWKDCRGHNAIRKVLRGSSKPVPDGGDN